MLSTVWNTERGSQSSIEKRRGRKETEVTRRRGGGIKRRETDPASDQFPNALHRLEHPETYTVTWRREEGGGR